MGHYTGDYSKKILPYGSGSTRGMTQRHYEAIADALRKVRELGASANGPTVQATVDLVARELAKRFADGNDRFREQTFLNAVTNAAQKGGEE